MKRWFNAFTRISENILFEKFDCIAAFIFSDWSALITYCTSGVPPPTPEPPILEQATISNLSLMWNKPITDVSKFALEMNDETTGYGFRTMYNGPELRYTVKHLARMTNYKFRVSIRILEGVYIFLRCKHFHISVACRFFLRLFDAFLK